MAIASGSTGIPASFIPVTAIQSKTYNALAFMDGIRSIEQAIQAAINQAVSDGFDAVFVPASMLPYNTSLVTFNTTIRMIREGGPMEAFDPVAYGANQALGADATPAFQAAENARAANRGYVQVPEGNYLINGTIIISTSDARWLCAPGAILNCNNATGPAIFIAGTTGFIEHIIMDGLRIIALVAAHRVPLITIGNSFGLERFLLRNTVLDGGAGLLNRDGILFDRVWEGHVEYVEALNWQNGGPVIQHRATDLNAGNIHFNTVMSTTASILMLFNENPGQGNLTNSLQFSNCKLARISSLSTNKFFAGKDNAGDVLGSPTITLAAGQGANYAIGDWIVVSSISGNKIWIDKVANVVGDILTLTAPAGLPFALAANDPVIVGNWHTILGANVRLAEFLVPHFERTNGVLGSGAHGVRIGHPLAGVSLFRGAYLINNCQGWTIDGFMQAGVNLDPTAVLLHTAADTNNSRNRLQGAIKVTGLTNYYQFDAPSSTGSLADQLGGVNTLLGVWHQDTTVAAAQTNVQLTGPMGATRSLRMRARGAITAMTAQVSTGRSAGTLTVTVFKNGGATTFTAVIDGTNTFFKLTEQVTESAMVTFAPGDTIDVRVTTDAGWLPTANNLDVALYASL